MDAVDGRAGAGSQPGERFNNKQILCEFHGENTLLQDLLQAAVVCLSRLRRSDVVGAAVWTRFFDQTHILDIAGECGLGASDASLRQSIQKLVLCLNVLVLNNL